MSMTPAQWADWKARMDAALANYQDQATAKATLFDSPDAATVLAYNASVAGADSAVLGAARDIETLQAEFIAAATPMDTVAPTVVSTYPAPGYDSIPVGIAGIVIEFSEEMDPSTITTTNVYLTDVNGDPVGLVQTGNPALTGGGKIATITHTTDLAAGTYYRIFVSNDVRDIYGNFMEYDYLPAMGFETVA